MTATSIHFDSGKLSRLIGLGYEAERAPAAWREFATDIAAASGSQMALIQYVEDAHPERSFLVCGGLGSDFEETFSKTSWLSEDDQFWVGIRSKPSGTVRLGNEILPREVMRRSPYYARVAMPWKLEHFLISAITRDNGISAFLSLGRTGKATPFVPGDKALFGQSVLSHLQRSFTLQQALEETRQTNVVLSAVVDRTPYGVVVFDARGQPIFVNNQASTIFAATEDLTLINGQLQSTDPAANAKLEAALVSALYRALGVTVAPPPDPVFVPRRYHAQPYQVAFSPLNLPSGHTAFPPGSAVIALIHDRWMAGSRYVPTILRTTYSLTRAEIRLCQAMLDGRSLPEAASTLAISRNTAKTHLTRIFDKTGVRSQAALLRLLTLGT